jgi:hypothetical protein
MWAINGLSSTTAGASPEYWKCGLTLDLDQTIDHAPLTKAIVAGWYFKANTAP